MTEKDFLYNSYFKSCSSIPEHPNFHKPSGEDAPFLYAILSQNSIMPLSCPPAMQYTGSDKSKTLVKGIFIF